jgi:RNA polymerase sigma factor (sigma-70 family)
MDYDDLLRAARAGESWAGPALVTALMPMLLRYVAEIGGDLAPADQEAVVERAVLRSVDQLERYDARRASFPTWVRGALRYAVADHRRAGGSTEVLVGDLPDTVAPPPFEPRDDETDENLTWALLHLTMTDQVIIALRDFEGLTYAQCADRIGGGVSEGACRVRHHRALRRLRDVLATDPNYQHLLGD